MKRFHLIFLLLCLMGAAVSASPSEIRVTMVGVPRYMGENPNYEDWFAELASAGVTAFLPFSIYQEIPEPLSLGYEADFFPPCSYEDEAFQALREANIQLLVAGQVLYGEAIPAMEDDPLLALMECAGEGMISAVLSIDEPSLNTSDGSSDSLSALYERVKAIDPNLPVMMVHAPIPVEVTEADGTARPVRQDEVDTYLANVEAASAYADIIGFDLYPIPFEIAGLIAPNRDIELLDYQEAFPAYLDYLAKLADGRPYFLVLQAFSYERQLSPEIAQEARDAGYNIRFPTEAELQEMACLAVEGGASEIAWWGGSFLLEEDAEFWNSILAVTKGITADAEDYCN
jgi:hypothetical protein